MSNLKLNQCVVKKVCMTLFAVLAVNTSNISAGERQFYFGAGGGQSTIKPSTRSVDITTGFRVEDDNDGLIKLFAGYDLTDYWSVEGSYANYGTAKLSGPADFNQGNGTAGLGNNFLGNSETIFGEVDYSVLAGQALLQFPNNNAGLSAILKIGVAQISTSSSANLPFTQANEIKFTTGFGLEYSLKNGVAVRAEYEYQDENIQGVSISALKRFGKRKVKTVPAPKQPIVAKTKPQQKPKAPSKAKPTVAKPAKPAAAPKLVVPQGGLSLAPSTDSDGDGVIDQLDRCADTRRGTQVTATGCPVLVTQSAYESVQPIQSVETYTYEPVQTDGHTRILEGVSFGSGSATLTSNSKLILDGIAADLIQRPGVSIAVVGHTDSLGNAAKNKQLSERRAEAVANYIASRGFDPQRLRFGGKGEEMPLMLNTTAEGRAVNRRVELIEE